MVTLRPRKVRHRAQGRLVTEWQSDTVKWALWLATRMAMQRVQAAWPRADRESATLHIQGFVALNRSSFITRVATGSCKSLDRLVTKLFTTRNNSRPPNINDIDSNLIFCFVVLRFSSVFWFSKTNPLLSRGDLVQLSVGKFHQILTQASGQILNQTLNCKFGASGSLKKKSFPFCKSHYFPPEGQ